MHGRGKSCENGLTRRGFVVAGAGAAAALAVPSWARARGGSAAELVLRNGRVHTVAGGADAEGSRDRGGRIAYVGSNAGAEALAGPATEVIDLGGRMVMPGIHDGHMHPLCGRPRAHAADPQLPPAQPAAVRRRDPQAARALGRGGARRLALGRALGRHRDGQAADQGGPRRARDLAADPRHLARRPHRARQLASARDRRRRRLDPRPARRGDPPRPGQRADRDPARQRDRPRRRSDPAADAGAERAGARGGPRG